MFCLLCYFSIQEIIHRINFHQVRGKSWTYILWNCSNFCIKWTWQLGGNVTKAARGETERQKTGSQSLTLPPSARGRASHLPPRSISDPRVQALPPLCRFVSNICMCALQRREAETESLHKHTDREVIERWHLLTHNERAERLTDGGGIQEEGNGNEILPPLLLPHKHTKTHTPSFSQSFVLCTVTVPVFASHSFLL